MFRFMTAATACFYHLCIVIDNTDTVNIQNRIHDFEHIFSLVADFAKVGYGKYNFDTQTGTAIPQWFRNLGEPVHSSVREVAGPGIPLCAPGGSQTHVCVLRCGPEP